VEVEQSVSQERECLIMANWPEELIPRNDMPAAVKRVMRLPKEPHEATVRRWYTKGINGVLLDVIYIGSRPHTTKSRIEDFFRCISDLSRRTRQPVVSAPSPMKFDKRRAKRVAHQARTMLKNWGAK